MEKFFTDSNTLSTDFVFHCHDFGHLIYWQKHGQISIQVRQEKQYRWLLINDTLQSVIDREAPSRLLLPHLQQLAGLWQPLAAPKTVLELGLGAGAIRNYLESQYPTVHVTSIEKDPEVIRCYKKYFDGDALSALVCDDAERVVQKNTLYDWIILDLFSQEDAPNFLFNHKFYQNIRNRLNKGGWLFINFLSNHPSQLEQLQHRLITNFGKKPNEVAIPDYLNHIIAVSR